MTQTIPTRPPAATEVATECPHCHREFVASIDASQPPRLQGAKCPNCKLFVPARLLPERPVMKKDTPVSRKR